MLFRHYFVVLFLILYDFQIGLELFEESWGCSDGSVGWVVSASFY